MTFHRLNLLLFIVLSFIGIISGLVYSKLDIDWDKQTLDSRLNELLCGKYSISDGSQFGYRGFYYDSNRLHYALFDQGFYLCDLTKESGGFVKLTRRAGDLYFSYPEVRWVPNEFIFGYHVPGTGCFWKTNRPLPDYCYRQIFHNNMIGTESYKVESYSPGKMNEILNFPSTYFSKYYYVAQNYHPSEFYFNKYFQQSFPLESGQIKINCENSFYSITTNYKSIIMCTSIHTALGLLTGILLAFFTSLVRKVWMIRARGVSIL